ncbi:hypothetical protein DUNSADRAFT_18453 [Dunaliella salina]|uniref:Uncharacterized protein n=1 Tax=Dunaliella salina TaxID=3046 RepID=A0ABQ7G033_DUNSA|nr:hypothetical protein DUNSADRAFT_18453 [Dunaliella salina]|eukprot:KAF5827965.1 hypothetical protein DUNSADRAFT_18453 [Dunaliella salina]
MPFQAIKERWTDFVLQLAPKTDAEVSYMDEFSMVLKNRRAAGGLDRNMTIRTTNNPNDPFGLRLPEFGGDLMQHRFCSLDGTATGPPLSRAAVLEANFTFAPTWIISGSEQLVDRLADVSEWGINPIRIEGKWLPTALVIFVRNASFALSSGKAANGTLLRSDTLLHGPLSSFRPTLDFANEKGLIRMGLQADLFIKNLDLSGLKLEAIEDNGGADKDTTLHLVGIDRQDRQIEVAQVTLRVAKQDFIALLSAAHRGE